MNRCVDSHSPDETRRLGAALGERLERGDVVCIQGPLGAGKTCLVQGVARGLGVPEDVPVTSPTFTYVGEYFGRIPLAHADFYRVESVRRLEDAGFDDLLDGTGALVVEWPELCPEALPREHLWIRLEIRSESERRLYVEGVGQRAQRLAEELLEAWA
jgi:tRNA threonylcarbamoyladenosine biosynthesis protein TsaE